MVLLPHIILGVNLPRKTGKACSHREHYDDYVLTTPASESGNMECFLVKGSERVKDKKIKI